MLFRSMRFSAGLYSQNTSPPPLLGERNHLGRLKANLVHIHGVEAELEDEMVNFNPEDFKRMERDSENAQDRFRGENRL